MAERSAAELAVVHAEKEAALEAQAAAMESLRGDHSAQLKDQALGSDEAMRQMTERHAEEMSRFACRFARLCMHRHRHSRHS